MKFQLIVSALFAVLVSSADEPRRRSSSYEYAPSLYAQPARRLSFDHARESYHQQIHGPFTAKSQYQPVVEDDLKLTDVTQEDLMENFDISSQSIPGLKQSDTSVINADEQEAAEEEV